MVCDLSNILNNEGAKLPFDVIIPQKDIFADDTRTFPQGVHVVGQVVCMGDVLKLNASVTGELHTVCARCLVPLTRDVSFSFEEDLIQEGTEVTDRDSYIVFWGTQIDLSDIVSGNVLLNLSYRYLCKSDCRGLCSVCGTNLNEACCNCREEEIDPRWEALKDFKL